MSKRADDLADRFKTFNNELIGFVENNLSWPSSFVPAANTSPTRKPLPAR